MESVGKEIGKMSMNQKGQAPPGVDQGGAQENGHFGGDRVQNKPKSRNSQGVFADYTTPFSMEDGYRLLGTPALEPLHRLGGWVLWRWTLNAKGKWDKPPFQVDNPSKSAANNRSSTWGRFHDALWAAVQNKMSGVGFCLHFNLACFDLDKCVDPGTGWVAPWARRLIEECQQSITIWPPNPFTGWIRVEEIGCYCEVTPSGTGLRIWGYGRDQEVETQDIKMPCAAEAWRFSMN